MPSQSPVTTLNRHNSMDHLGPLNREMDTLRGLNLPKFKEMLAEMFRNAKREVDLSRQELAKHSNHQPRW